MRSLTKILQWSANGFWLHYRRLEKGTFKWPGIEDDELSLTISTRQLHWELKLSIALCLKGTSVWLHHLNVRKLF
ncbi:IS66 family insertion sequence element accessory protein TnpB [Marinomonas fungiae]|uniref:IS66 family insertion sequence element accessory protein TnpB n=1 Tax=Marinomonas fungiae TaxID=1137284 RepID=UPI0009EA70BF